VISEPVGVAGRSISVTACIGLSTLDSYETVVGDPARIGQDLLRQAGFALRAAKEAGRGQWCRYESERHERLVQRLRLREALARAVVTGSFQLRYQPIVTLDRRTVVGFEALVRWEETGLIEPIGDLVLRTAVAAAVDLAAAGSYVSVNVSARQLRAPGFSDRVARVLADAGLRPELLMLEMTESVLMREEDNVWAELAILRDLGCRLAIDDFGTGFSSLSYLEQTPIDVIKIDRTFVANLVDSERQRTVVEGIVRMAEKLGLQVVAEGIENPDQCDLLAGMRCPYGQGYLFARALSLADAKALTVGPAAAAATPTVVPPPVVPPSVVPPPVPPPVPPSVPLPRTTTAEEPQALERPGG
jgi:EAL domain-containing protein (putative c-di-GMP-specific phosphodiesterase class I)